MRLEEGKYYRDRAGNIVGPMHRDTDGFYARHLVDGYYPIYLEDGTSDFFTTDQEPQYDLIEEVDEE